MKSGIQSHLTSMSTTACQICLKLCIARHRFRRNIGSSWTHAVSWHSTCTCCLCYKSDPGSRGSTAVISCNLFNRPILMQLHPVSFFTKQIWETMFRAPECLVRAFMRAIYGIDDVTQSHAWMSWFERVAHCVLAGRGFFFKMA